jgi:hypothetical protein
MTTSNRNKGDNGDRINKTAGTCQFWPFAHPATGAQIGLEKLFFPTLVLLFKQTLLYFKEFHPLVSWHPGTEPPLVISSPGMEGGGRSWQGLD